MGEAIPISAVLRNYTFLSIVSKILLPQHDVLGDFIGLEEKSCYPTVCTDNSECSMKIPSVFSSMIFNRYEKTMWIWNY